MEALKLPIGAAHGGAVLGVWVLRPSNESPAKSLHMLCIVLFFSLRHNQAITQFGTGGVGHTTGLN